MMMIAIELLMPVAENSLLAVNENDEFFVVDNLSNEISTLSITPAIETVPTMQSAQALAVETNQSITPAIVATTTTATPVPTTASTIEQTTASTTAESTTVEITTPTTVPTTVSTLEPTTSTATAAATDATTAETTTPTTVPTVSTLEPTTSTATETTTAIQTTMPEANYTTETPGDASASILPNLILVTAVTLLLK